MTSTLILLTRNEIDGVKALYDKIPFDEVDEVFVVDGGSSDGTVEFFGEKKIKVISQDKNGRGIAFRLGMREAKGENLVYFSPDGNEDPNDILKLFELLGQGNDIVIASRFMEGAKSDDSDDPLLVRRFGNKFFTFLVNMLWDADVTDAINGFRGIKKSKLARLHQDADEHEVEFQMTIRSAKLGYKIKEIPTQEHERIGGERKANTWRMGWRFSKFLLMELIKGKNF